MMEEDERKRGGKKHSFGNFQLQPSLRHVFVLNIPLVMLPMKTFTAVCAAVADDLAFFVIHTKINVLTL